jgi:type IV pilus assembly protein PilF
MRGTGWIRGGCQGLALALAMLLGCSTLSDKDLARAETHLQLAQLKLRKGDLRYAVREYRAVIEIDDRNVEAHFGLAETLRRLGSLPEAEAEFKRTLKIDPEHDDARLNLSVVYLQGGRWQEAIDVTTLLIDDPGFLNPARAYVNRGWARYKTGNLEGAEKDLREALHTDSSSFQAHMNMGIVLYERGSTLEAMKSFDRVVSLLDKYDNPTYSCVEAEARFRLAQAYVKLSDRTHALEHLQKAGAVSVPCPWRDQAEEYLAVLK